MNKRDAKRFQKILLDERRRLSDDIRRIEDSTRYESDNDGGVDLTGFAEVGTDSFERTTALNIASNESDRLNEVDDALDRIEKGVFGKCEGCAREIPHKRLEAFPSARYCIECQAKLERDGAL